MPKTFVVSLSHRFSIWFYLNKCNFDKTKKKNKKKKKRERIEEYSEEEKKYMEKLQPQTTKELSSLTKNLFTTVRLFIMIFAYLTILIKLFRSPLQPNTLTL